MADPVPTKVPAAPKVAEPAPVAPDPDPALPAAVVVNADYAWFDANGNFTQRSAGDLVTDAAEIAYLVARAANFTAQG